jgi:hypothetical protein
MGNYAYLALDTVGLRVLAERSFIPTPHERARTTVYIDVHDVDAIYAERQAQLAALPEADVLPLCDQDYGMRELSVRMPDGDWLTFGQSIRKQEAR